MATDVLSITLDTAEPRVASDNKVYRADGRHWDILKSTAFVDGITRTGMLYPLPLTPQWSTITTGLYKRLGKADFTFDTPPVELIGTPPPYPPGTPANPDKWVEYHWPYQGNVYLIGQGVNDRVITSQKWPRNKGFYLSWFSYNAGQSSLVQMECGWLSETGFIGLRIWTDGKCEIYKQGILVGEGNIYERRVTTQTVYGKESESYHRPKSSKGDAKQLAQQTVDLFLIPCRRRDLLLISNQGGGFRFSFKDLDPDNPDNEITPADARLVWRVPVGQPTVLLAPLNFATSGSLIGDIMAPRIPPKSGASPTGKVYADQPGYGSGAYTTSLQEPDLSGPFAPDGTKRLARIEVDLTGDGTASPWVYGASLVFESDIASTDGTNATDITDFVVSNTLSVPENPADVTYKVTCKAPEGMEEAGAVGIRSMENRPVECKIGSISFLTGRSGTPSWKEAISDDARRVMLEFRDRAKGMEDYHITDPVPVDGLQLEDGFTYFATLPGYPKADIDIPSFGYPLPTIGQASEGEFALLPERNDRALDWFAKLHKLYAPDNEWCWKPTVNGPTCFMRHLDVLDAAPSFVTLYAKIEDAVNAGIPRDFAPYWVYRSLDPSHIKCEANEITVQGQDPRTGVPFSCRYTDKSSQDPTLSPSQRPANWVGEPRVFGYADPSIINRAYGNLSVMKWARRLTPPRDLFQFTAFFQFLPDGSPVWRTDKITLDGVGDVRILTLNGSFQTEVAGDTPEEDHLWRPYTYVGQLMQTPI